MKHIYKLILEACGLSVLFTSITFIFEIITFPETFPDIYAGQYFLILLFSFSVVGANLLFGIKQLHRLVSLLIHYLIVFVTFILAFVGFEGMTPSKFFIYIVMFTIFYAVVFAIVFGIKSFASKADARIKAKAPAPKKQIEYKPRYK